MKKTILISTILSMYCLLVTYNAGFGQTRANEQGFIDSKILLAVPGLGNPSNYENTKAAPAEEVNIRAIRDFRKTFKTIIDERWYNLSNGYVAIFNAVGIKNSVVYDKKGHCKFSIRYYYEKQLPDQVRESVKSIYYDYSITRVEEILIDTKLIYIIHMENENKWKNVRVSEGEVQLLEDLDKH